MTHIKLQDNAILENFTRPSLAVPQTNPLREKAWYYASQTL